MAKNANQFSAEKELISMLMKLTVLIAWTIALPVKTVLFAISAKKIIS